MKTTTNRSLTIKTKLSLGIIGGAGPMAGALLFRRIIEVCQKKYHCHRDQDFPEIMLLNKPFIEMLTTNNDLTDQLDLTLKQLDKYGNTYIVIACNTLHGFIRNHSDYPKLISMTNETTKIIKQGKYQNTLVLATSTSLSKQLYHFEGAKWPTPESQHALDRIIDSILSGDTSKNIMNRFERIINTHTKLYPKTDSIILGCTELSVLLDQFKSKSFRVRMINPIEEITYIICQKLLSES